MNIIQQKKILKLVLRNQDVAENARKNEYVTIKDLRQKSCSKKN